MPKPTLLTRDIVKNAKVACLEKFGIVQMAFGAGDTEMKTMKADIDQVFTAFDDPNFWTRPVPCDKKAILDTTSTLRGLDHSDLVGIVLDIRKLLGLLEKTLPDTGLESFSSRGMAADPVVNRMVLDALLGVPRKMLRRLQFFGQPLMQDAEFKQMHDKQKPLVQSYNDQLESGAIGANLTDRDDVVAQGSKIEGSTTIPVFKQQFDGFTELVKKKLSSNA